MPSPAYSFLQEVNLRGVYAAMLALFLSGVVPALCAGTGESAKEDYQFDGKISRPVLESYLARSATVASLLHMPSDDDLRMMKNTGVKFAGRAIWMWRGESKMDDLVRVG